jgi:putative addiction module component (TIGR02574 family)
MAQQLIRDFDLAVLTPGERLALARQLIDSTQGRADAPRLTAEQQAEILRRMARLDAAQLALVA